MYKEHAPAGARLYQIRFNEKYQFSVEFSISRSMKNDVIVSCLSGYFLCRVVRVAVLFPKLRYCKYMAKYFFQGREIYLKNRSRVPLFPRAVFPLHEGVSDEFRLVAVG